MYTSKITAVMAVCLFSLLVQEGVAQTAVSNSSSAVLQSQIAVLTNGQVVKGVVSRTSEQVAIQTSQGSRIVLQKDQLDFVCDSLQEAYWHRSARTKASDNAAQQQLFFWCLEHKLLEEAQNQIDILQLTDIKATRLEFLHRQLEVENLKMAIKREQALAASQIANPKLRDSQSTALSPAKTNQQFAGNVGTGKPMPLSNSQAFPVKPSQTPTNTLLSPMAPARVAGASPEASQPLAPLPSRWKMPTQRSALAELDLANQNQGDLVITSLPEFPGAKNSSVASSQAALPAIPNPSTQQPPTIALPGSLAAQAAATETEMSNPVEPGKIAQVGFAEAIQPVPELPGSPMSREIASPSTNGPTQPTIQQLDLETKSLPRDAVVMYKRKIEPMFVRGCLATGCHSSNETNMPLMTMGGSQLTPRRMSQRNMHHILKFADANVPLESRLLSAATTPHGGAATSVVKPGSKQFQNLANWLIMISNRPNQPHTLPAVYLPQPATRVVAKAKSDSLPKDKLTMPGTNAAPDIPGLEKLEASTEEKPDKSSNPLIAELLDPAVLQDPIYSRLLPDADVVQAAKAADKIANQQTTGSSDETKKEDDSESSDPFDPNEFNQKFK